MNSRMIVAIIKPFLAEKVIKALGKFDIDELMIREVKGFGRQKNHLAKYEQNEYSVAFLPKVEISLWVSGEQVDDVVKTVRDLSRTGRMGDGKIMVLPTTIDTSIT